MMDNTEAGTGPPGFVERYRTEENRSLGFTRSTEESTDSCSSDGNFDVNVKIEDDTSKKPTPINDGRNLLELKVVLNRDACNDLCRQYGIIVEDGNDSLVDNDDNTNDSLVDNDDNNSNDRLVDNDDNNSNDSVDNDDNNSNVETDNTMENTFDPNSSNKKLVELKVVLNRDACEDLCVKYGVVKEEYEYEYDNDIYVYSPRTNCRETEATSNTGVQLTDIDRNYRAVKNEPPNPPYGFINDSPYYEHRIVKDETKTDFDVDYSAMRIEYCDKSAYQSTKEATKNGTGKQIDRKLDLSFDIDDVIKSVDDGEREENVIIGDKTRESGIVVFNDVATSSRPSSNHNDRCYNKNAERYDLKNNIVKDETKIELDIDCSAMDIEYKPSFESIKSNLKRQRDGPEEDGVGVGAHDSRLKNLLLSNFIENRQSGSTKSFDNGEKESANDKSTVDGGYNFRRRSKRVKYDIVGDEFTDDDWYSGDSDDWYSYASNDPYSYAFDEDDPDDIDNGKTRLEASCLSDSDRKNADKYAILCKRVVFNGNVLYSPLFAVRNDPSITRIKTPPVINGEKSVSSSSPSNERKIVRFKRKLGTAIRMKIWDLLLPERKITTINSKCNVNDILTAILGFDFSVDYRFFRRPITKYYFSSRYRLTDDDRHRVTLVSGSEYVLIAFNARSIIDILNDGRLKSIRLTVVRDNDDNSIRNEDDRVRNTRIRSTAAAVGNTTVFRYAIGGVDNEIENIRRVFYRKSKQPLSKKDLLMEENVVSSKTTIINGKRLIICQSYGDGNLYLSSSVSKVYDGNNDANVIVGDKEWRSNQIYSKFVDSRLRNVPIKFVEIPIIHYYLYKELDVCTTDMVLQHVYVCPVCSNRFLDKTTVYDHWLTLHRTIIRRVLNCGSSNEVLGLAQYLQISNDQNKYSNGSLLFTDFTVISSNTVRFPPLLPSNANKKNKPATGVRNRNNSSLPGAGSAFQNNSTTACGNISNVVQHSDTQSTSTSAQSGRMRTECLQSTTRATLPLTQLKKSVEVKCDICGKLFECKETLQIHIKSLHRTYEKDASSNIVINFRDNQVIRPNYYEEVVINDELKYQCILCSAILKNSLIASVHLVQRHTEPIFQCPRCPKKLTTRGGLRKHVLSTHTRTFHCSQCGKSFGEAKQLTRHEEGFHSSRNERCRCDICGNIFKTNRCLLIHKEHMHDFQPKRCDICHKLCTSYKMYYSHKRFCGKKNVSRREQCICDVCKKTYSSKHTLAIHMNQHLNLKPYKCGVCKAAFSSPNYLCVHKAVHLKQSFACSICGNTFTRKDNMKLHMKNQHTES